MTYYMLVQDILVHSKLQKVLILVTVLGVRATCDHVSINVHLYGSRGTIRIEQNFRCSSESVVYAIHCIKCNKRYIGETGRRLGDRFN